MSYKEYHQKELTGKNIIFIIEWKLILGYVIYFLLIRHSNFPHYKQLSFYPSA